MKVYAIYKGDKFIDVGTAKELAERRGVSVRTIWWMATKECHQRVEGTDRTLAISFVEDEEKWL